MSSDKKCQHKDIKGFIEKTKYCEERKCLNIYCKVQCQKCGKTWAGIVYKADEIDSI